MIKEIKYGGFSASPSDYESPDGELAALIGFVPDEGHLKPIVPAKTLFTNELLNGRVVKLLHKTSSGTHYILYDATNNTFSWIDSSGNGDNLYTFSQNTSVYDVNAIGNTLVVLTSSGMHYFLWQANLYKHLGTHLPELNIEFGVEKERVYIENKIDMPAKIHVTDSVIDSSADNSVDKDTTVQLVTNAVLGAINKLLQEQGTEKGYFSHPFFVRWAYRLYDGSLSMHSSPILMPAIFEGTVKTRNLTDVYNGKMIGSTHIRLLNSGNTDTGVIDQYAGCEGSIYKLVYKATSNNSAIKDWFDIIRSIDVFVSSPIYKYKQSGKVERIEHKVLNLNTGEYLADLTANVDDSNARYMEEIYYVLPTYDDVEVTESIENKAQFYKIGSIDINNLAINQTEIKLREKLDSLVNHELMSDDYDSHDTLFPACSFSYNSRLNLANLSKKLYEGYPLSLYSGSFEYNDKIAIAVKYINNDKTLIYRSEKTGVSFPDKWFFYSPHACKTTLSIVVQKNGIVYHKSDIMLKPHQMMNGSFVIVTIDELISDGSTYSANVANLPSATPLDSEDWLVSLPNKIYTSEVDNPFFFPVLSINTVGTGSILGISTAAKALSQGQFGQFPLYAFTSDGVWALEVSSNGGYSAKQPITRDVCINQKSITQLDNAVLFATNRGIILLSGSNSQCISDILDCEQVFNINSLPHINDLATLGGFSKDDFKYIDFRAFLLDCRMIYAYTQQRVIIYNPSYSYAYVYSIKTKMWGMMLSSVADNVASYPNAFAMLNNGSLVDFCENAPDAEENLQGIKGMIITRPIKLDAPDLLKTIDCIIQRGDFRKGSIKSAIYGSRDLDTWSLIWTSEDHYLRGFRGTPYKYFRLVLLCDMKPHETLFGSTFQYTPKLTNQPR